jgi:hypothetical protein
MDAEVCPDHVAAWAASITPGSAVVTSLVALDPERMSHEGRVDAVAALDKHLSMFHALQDRFLAVMAQDPPVQQRGEITTHHSRSLVASHRAMAAMRLGTRRLPAVDRAWLR